jgi:hypothetical protein
VYERSGPTRKVAYFLGKGGILAKTYQDVVDIKNREEKKYLELPQVTGMDVIQSVAEGAAQYIIHIHVRNKKDLPEDLKNLNYIDGVPVIIIERKYELH